MTTHPMMPPAPPWVPGFTNATPMPEAPKAPKAQGHIHAEAMREYAKDAFLSETPWEGWQVKPDGFDWEDCRSQPLWAINAEYRRKPRFIKINGFNVPEPLREPPEYGTVYWAPCLDGEELFCGSVNWRGSEDHVRDLKRGLVHLTQEAAITHAKALLSFTQTVSVAC